MRKARYKVFAMGSASHRLQRCLCVTETEGEEPLAFRINLETARGRDREPRHSRPAGRRGCTRPANSERLRRAESAPRGTASGTTGVRAKAVIPLRALSGGVGLRLVLPPPARKLRACPNNRIFAESIQYVVTSLGQTNYVSLLNQKFLITRTGS